MNNINYIYIIPLIATLLVSIYIFITAKNTTHNKKSKYLNIILVISILSSALLVNFYYDKEFEKQSTMLREILNTNLNLNLKTDLDSLDVNKLESLKSNSHTLIDSINLQNIELEKLKKEIENLEKIIGEKEELKNDINKKIKINNFEIGEIKSYNQKLDEKILYKRKGYMSSGQSSNFIFECPKDYESDILELKLKFIDESLVDKIEYITISFSEKTGERNYVSISNEVFKPQKDVNAFKVKNHFKNNKGKKIDLEVGYTLKSEANKEYPEFERIVCKNY
ncbi:hypothetical protein B0A78_00475 [Flavobacterium columnare NBRC 100251 = ATCC 23463]|uniref:hypothetical protein n=1 Tax=Flavobacterium columnare TaxID=996 RepID=UPI000BEADF96|nr:hypothetical protein [Flavobacterium columnare]MBF6654012.1 hypothetical protein [Flavobacterium columnare]MBF6655790.1 hypothetical protein [Flavobacterium columnare]MBF6658644.1 hypothetical protein [Flavobacterium columnare]PDS27235.1 hypothetical protein B0A78_00475 [Flavobacterium columnare NBRC 100251 = ATCC 23463]GEM59219.1 hypothetical protein FC1_24570 [Flavobacterium columnare NBRC 100251 = ATCC 23463]